jgi:questin oxidase-like protein
LERLLDDNARFDLGGRGTVNHLPMVLIALSRMGASDARLVEYFGWWEENRALPRRDSGQEVGDDWRAHIGDPSMFAALSDYFRQWILDRGTTEVITTVFPVMSRGVAAAAFHGLIRLAYGSDADHAGEIAAGLATLCSRYADLGLDLSSKPDTSVAAGFGRLADALNGATFTGQGIIGRMIAAASDARFQAAMSVPQITPDLLEEIARAGIALYWSEANFTVLHMVTATHAARILFSRFPALVSDTAITALWEAVCAAYASVGAPFLAELPAKIDPPSWSEIFARATTINDDHVIKMTYTCHCEAARYGNPLYQAAAARLVAVGSS